MRFIATTIIRHAPFSHPVSGRIFYGDLIKKTILKEKPVPYPLFPLSDKNPRGGSRGGRGVGIKDGKIYIANYDSIIVYDKDLKSTGRITNPLFAGLHEIEIVKDGIWVASTWLDLVIKVDFNGKIIYQWYYRNDEDFLRKIKLDAPPVLDLKNDYRRYLKGGVSVLKLAHVNSVRTYRSNNVVITLGMVTPLKKTAVSGYVIMLDIDREEASVLYRRKTGFPMHNARILFDRYILMNDSHRMEVLLIGLKDKKIKKKIKIPGTWLRGLAVCDKYRIIVGASPASVYEIDLQKGEITSRFNLSLNPNEAVHGLAIIDE